jgi:hypothetical protein
MRQFRFPTTRLSSSARLFLFGFFFFSLEKVTKRSKKLLLSSAHDKATQSHEHNGEELQGDALMDCLPGTNRQDLATNSYREHD